MSWFTKDNYGEYKVIFTAFDEDEDTSTVASILCDAISPRAAIKGFLLNNFDLWEMYVGDGFQTPDIEDFIDFVEDLPHTYIRAQKYFDNAGFIISVIKVD